MIPNFRSWSRAFAGPGKGVRARRRCYGAPPTQNWMRDYDPMTGRYIQADPLGLVDGASVYGYALQNPGRYIDPRGEQGIDGLVSSSFGRGAMSIAGGAAAVDGPLPIGDAVGLCVIGAAVLYCAAGGEYCNTSGRDCDLVDDRVWVDPKEGLIRSCTYVCDDGTNPTLIIPASRSCPDQP